MTTNRKKIVIGVSGAAGSFSEQAGKLYLQKNKIKSRLVYLIDMEGVLSALKNKKINIGIFPVVNSQGGLVQMAFEAMGKYNFKFIDKYILNVHQCLMTLPETSKVNVKKIYSHVQALTQCKRYLKKNYPKSLQVKWIDTAQAAKDLSQGKFEKYTAVIAPAESAKNYGLKILDKNIEDSKPNLTTFIIVK